MEAAEKTGTEQEETEELKKAEEQIPQPQAQKKSRRLPPLLRLTRRATVFLSFSLTGAFIFFITGNKQTFLDSNLNMILQIIAVIAITLAFISLAAVIECIYYLARAKKIRLTFHLVCYAIVFTLSILTTIFSLTINLLSEGIEF